MGKINYPHLFILIARLILSGVFLQASLPKIKDPVAFAISVHAFQITSPEISNWVALFLPWLEMILGIGILFPLIRRSSVILIAVLLFIFIGLHFSAWIRGLDISCGCFGTKSSTSESTNYLWLITRNTVLLCACSLVIFKDRRNNETRIKNSN